MRHLILAEPPGLSSTLAPERDDVVAAWDEPSEQPRPGSRPTTQWRPLAALDPIAAQWRAFAGRALEPNVFYEPAFALAAAPAFASLAGVVLVWSSDAPRRLVGLFPLAVARRRYGISLPVLAAWTHAYAPLGVALVERETADAAIEAFLDHVAGEPDLPKTLLLPHVPLDGPFAMALRRVLARRGGPLATFDRHLRAQLMPGPARADYIDRAVAGKRRKELRRLRRRLEERAPVTLATATTPDAVAGALGDFLALEAASWKGRRGTAAAQNPTTNQFLERAIGALAADGMARVDRLMWADRAIAAAITLRSADTAWFFKIAYDEALARFSPGVQLTLELTAALLADTAIERVDSCAVADHPMIDHLWRERLAIGDLMVAAGPGGTTGFALACRLEGLRREVIAAAKRLRNIRRKR